MPLYINKSNLFQNTLVLTSYLFSFGAHIGHLKCDTYHGLFSYVLGTRHYFAVFDINKTIPMIKNALLFFEQIVYNFGQALFCYSSVSVLNTHIRNLFVSMTKDRNQSFSYWRWAPGCITNYRTVFLRLTTYLFRNARASWARNKHSTVSSSYALRSRLQKRILSGTADIYNTKSFLFKHRFSFFRRLKYSTDMFDNIYLRKRKAYISSAFRRKRLYERSRILRKIRGIIAARSNISFFARCNRRMLRDTKRMLNDKLSDTTHVSNTVRNMLYKRRFFVRTFVDRIRALRTLNKKHTNHTHIMLADMHRIQNNNRDTQRTLNIEPLSAKPIMHTNELAGMLSNRGTSVTSVLLKFPHSIKRIHRQILLRSRVKHCLSSLRKRVKQRTSAIRKSVYVSNAREIPESTKQPFRSSRTLFDIKVSRILFGVSRPLARIITWTRDLFSSKLSRCILRLFRIKRTAKHATYTNIAVQFSRFSELIYSLVRKTTSNRLANYRRVIKNAVAVNRSYVHRVAGKLVICVNKTSKTSNIFKQYFAHDFYKRFFFLSRKMPTFAFSRQVHVHTGKHHKINLDLVRTDSVVDDSRAINVSSRERQKRAFSRYKLQRRGRHLLNIARYFYRKPSSAARLKISRKYMRRIQYIRKYRRIRRVFRHKLVHSRMKRIIRIKKRTLVSSKHIRNSFSTQRTNYAPLYLEPSAKGGYNQRLRELLNIAKRQKHPRHLNVSADATANGSYGFDNKAYKADNSNNGKENISNILGVDKKKKQKSVPKMRRKKKRANLRIPYEERSESSKVRTFSRKRLLNNKNLINKPTDFFVIKTKRRFARRGLALQKRYRYARVNMFRTLPSFISMFIRLFYITKSKFDDFIGDNNSVSVDPDLYFDSVLKRFLLFWRAVIFFKCFRKTLNLPDCLVFFNPDNSISQLNDFSGVNLPIISVVDTITDIFRITYPMPSNDDSVLLLLFYFFLFLNACDTGMSARYVNFY